MFSNIIGYMLLVASIITCFQGNKTIIQLLLMNGGLLFIILGKLGR